MLTHSCSLCSVASQLADYRHSATINLYTIAIALPPTLSSSFEQNVTYDCKSYPLQIEMPFPQYKLTSYDNVRSTLFFFPRNISLPHLLTASTEQTHSLEVSRLQISLNSKYIGQLTVTNPSLERILYKSDLI
jgi:hypothetical protein